MEVKDENVYLHSQAWRNSQNRRRRKNAGGPQLESMFLDPVYPLPGGESNQDCQKRAVAVLTRILGDYQGHQIAIGTHGIVMTLMMGYFNSRYGGFEFLMQTSKPDIYRMEFEEERLIEVRRLWDGDE